MNILFLRLWCLLATILAWSPLAVAQGSAVAKVIPIVAPSEAGVKPCLAGTNFETEKYRIAHTTIDDPFKFLYWLDSKTRTMEAELRTLLDGQPFTYQLVDTKALGQIEKTRFAPDNGESFSLRVEFVSVQNCDTNKKTLDLIYRIYSTDPPMFSGGATESQETAEISPQSTAGLTHTGSPFHFTPTAGYNRSYNLFAGGQIDIAKKLKAFPLFDTFSAGGEASSSMHTVSVAASGGSSSAMGWVNHFDWRLNYRNDSLPAQVTRLASSELSVQIAAQSTTFWNDTVFARFGGLVGGGNAESNSLAAGLLPPQTVAHAAYGIAKVYAGLSSRTDQNVLSASYGLELGSIGPAAEVDWLKHIGDVHDEFWTSIGDHKPLEIESRFTVGEIEVPHTIPLTERFFGGNDYGQVFVPGDSWQILDVPVIRAIPANRWYLNGQGVGADRFASINLTVAYPVKSYPIMPKELSTDQDFNKLLNAQIVSATSIEQNYYAWKDPHFASALGRLPNLEQQLQTLQTTVNMAQSANRNQLQAAFSDCATNIATANFDVTNTLQAKGLSQYGDLSALLPVDTDDLKAVHDACAGELNGQLNDPDIASAAAAVDATRSAMWADFSAIDQALAAEKAASDTAFVKRTLNTLFKDLNIFSISPVAVFDTAWIGPSKGTLGGNRIGPGGGIRFELASYVNFTLGYARNVFNRPGEGTGALFFSMGVRDLFH